MFVKEVKLNFLIIVCWLVLIKYFVVISGKVRARKLNNIQPNKVEQVDYPLVLKAQGKAPYFQKRDEWRITDMLMNPMVSIEILHSTIIW